MEPARMSRGKRRFGTSDGCSTRDKNKTQQEQQTAQRVERTSWQSDERECSARDIIKMRKTRADWSERAGTTTTTQNVRIGGGGEREWAEMRWLVRICWISSENTTENCNYCIVKRPLTSLLFTQKHSSPCFSSRAAAAATSPDENAMNSFNFLIALEQKQNYMSAGKAIQARCWQVKRVKPEAERESQSSSEMETTWKCKVIVNSFIYI